MNKNRKGFTLVELIVVVTIFGVILGAILNMIKPANNVYHDADATMESNIIGSGLILMTSLDIRPMSLCLKIILVCLMFQPLVLSVQAV